MTETSPHDASRLDWPRLVARGLLFLVLIDLALVAVNAAGAPPFLDLDEERNFPTWYSSLKLLLTAAAALGCSRLRVAATSPRRQRLVWTAVAAVFTALSMDETATAHERLAAALLAGDAGVGLRARFAGGDATKDAFLWPILFAPVILALLYFLVTVLWNQLRRDRTSLLLGLAGCALFAAAVVLEAPAIVTSAPTATWGAAEVARYRLFVLFEESAEVAGATAMLAALARHLGHRLS